MSQTHSPRLPHYRWNFACYWAEYVFFSVGRTFADASTVMPAFVRMLTDSAPLMGLAGTIFTAAWTLPQLATARLLRDRPHKKPVMMWGLLGRVCPWFIALGLWAGLERHPGLMLALFFVSIALFAGSDGMAGVPYYDIMRRTLPVERRGRLFGTAQAFASLAGIGAGALVALILERRSFPGNYALLFALYSAFMIPSAVGLALIREPAPAAEPRATTGAVRAHWLQPLLADRTLKRLILCRIASLLAGLATPFYVLHAQDVLHLPQGAIGAFIIAQTLSSVASSILLGIVSDRRGPQSVIRIGSAAAVAGPLFALLAHMTGSALAGAYPFVFVVLGVANSTYFIGFSSYLIEIAPTELCTAYVGTTNTIVGLLSLMPVMGGWLLEATSYPVLFGTAILLNLLSFGLALGLKPAPQASRSLSEVA